MGQYYKCINITKDEYLNPHDFNSGAKLMEHSWFPNPLLLSVVQLLTDKWKGDRIVWAGDYGDEGLFLEDRPDAFYRDGNELRQRTLYDYANEHFTKVISTEEMDELVQKNYVLIDHDLKEYVRLSTLPDNDGWIVHPLSILTSNGNGRGGGDYRPPEYRKIAQEETDLYNKLYYARQSGSSEALDLEKQIADMQQKVDGLDPSIGRWAGHSIEASTIIPQGYRELSPDFEEK